MNYTGANIFSHSTSFKAVDYNMKKVDQGVADLLIVKNFDALRALDTATSSNYKSYLQAIARANPEIRQRQLHASLGVIGKSAEMMEIAKTAEHWLIQMGYGRQPYLIFGHYDVLHAHVHMVSSRITASAKLINNSLERLRANQVLDRVLGIDRSKKIKEDCIQALSYRFKNIEQFSILMKAKGYFVAKKNDQLHIYYQRMTRQKIPVELIAALSQDYTVDHTRLALIRRFVESNKPMASPELYQRNHLLVQRHRSKFGSWHSPLVALLQEQLSLEIVFENTSDRLPGTYMIIDNSSKQVYDGHELMSLTEFIKELPYRSSSTKQELSTAR